MNIKITLISILILIWSENYYAQSLQPNISFYKTEQDTWISYIENVENINPDTNINITFYHINLEVNVNTPFIKGNVLSKFLITKDQTSSIHLNLEKSLKIDSIKGNVKNYVFVDNLIIINTDSVFNEADSGEVDIYYSGIPVLAEGLKGLVYESHGNNEPIIASLSTPFLAHYWWPCKDGPGDKPDSVYIDITIEDRMIGDLPLIAVSNGILEDTIIQNGKKTFCWRERYPISPYYVMVAISNYQKYQQVYSSSDSNEFPIDYYTFNENYDQTVKGVEQIPEAIDLFSKLFGDYPFEKEKFGMTELGFYGAIENQTNVITNNMSEDWLNISVHELAHMWFGDMITCANWNHGWLNEGFATYCEALWVEHKYGVDQYHEYIKNFEFKSGGSIYLKENSDPFNIFLSIIYNKGAYVLHMLRRVLGDKVFFQSLYEYANSKTLRYGHAVTEEFQTICEEVSGKDLSKFFNQWIYGEYYPHYSFGYKVDTLENSHKINLIVEQLQDSTNLFWMPIDIKVYTESSEHTFVIHDSMKYQEFELLVHDKPVLIELDPDNWILKDLSEKILQPSLDQGVLLVNGVDWRIGDELYNAYLNKSFWGATEISFWDIYSEPIQGYPSTLPSLIGSGILSNSVISNYSTIVWISDRRSKDLAAWNNLALYSYLNAGGNVILITKQGQDFIRDDLKKYIGLSWDDSAMSTIWDMKAINDSFIDIRMISNNTLIALFDTIFTKDYSELIYRSSESFDFPRGSGVWSKPEGKGQFVYLAGRPYRFNYDDLKYNMQRILVDGMGEIVDVENELVQLLLLRNNLNQNYPNPFNPTTKISYSIQTETNVSLKVFDVLGREVTTLVNKEQPPGNYDVEFDASSLNSGVYFYRIQAGECIDTKKMILVK